jgi:hypothetical protein
MNPLNWTHEHQLAGVVVSAFGGVLGVLLGFIHSPSFSTAQPWPVFVAWLSFPQSYWPWPLFAFFISGLIFYAVQLLRKSN